jgi:hypothetical protein
MNSINIKGKSKYSIKILVLILCMAEALICQPNALEKTQVAPIKIAFSQPPEFYKKVFDLAFPPNRGIGISGYWMMVRFLPSFSAESQIVIRHEGKSEISIDYFVAGRGLQSLLAEEFSDSKNPDISRVAKLMEVKKTSIAAKTDAFEPWFQAFWKAFENSAAPLHKSAYTNYIQLDGTKYVLEYRDGDHHFSFELRGPELGYEDLNDPDDLPLVKWMLVLRKEILELSQHKKGEALKAPDSSAGDGQ